MWSCNLDMGNSDHRPICLDTEYLAGVAAQRRRSGRKFEARWLEEELVEEVVRTAWQKAVVRGLCPSASEKLAAVHKELHQWDRKVLKGPRARLKTTHQELEALMREPYDADGRTKQQDLTLKIENLLERRRSTGPNGDMQIGFVAVTVIPIFFISLLRPIGVVT